MRISPTVLSGNAGEARPRGRAGMRKLMPPGVGAEGLLLKVDKVGRMTARGRHPMRFDRMCMSPCPLSLF